MESKIVLLYDDYNTSSARDIVVGADQMSPSQLRHAIRILLSRFDDDYKVWGTLAMHGPAIPKEKLLAANFRDGIGLETDVLRIEFGREHNKTLPRGAIDLFILASQAESEAFTKLPLYKESVREGLPPIGLWKLPVLALHAYDQPGWSAIATSFMNAHIMPSPAAVARRVLGENDFGGDYGPKR